MSNKDRVSQLNTQYAFFHTAFNVVNIFIWGFYIILLYKATGSYLVLALDSLIYYVAMYIGTLWGGILVDKKGYLIAFRIQNALSALGLIFLLLILPQLSSLFILATFLRCIPRGMFWGLYHMFYLKENHGQKRDEFIGVMNSIVLLLGIVLPIIAGYLISITQGYEIVLAIGALIHLIAAIFPWKYNKRPKSEFRFSEVVKIMEHPKFNNFAFLNILNGANDVVPFLIFGLVPYLFLKNEFGVGIFASVVSIASAAVLYLERRDKIKNKIRMGVVGFFIEGLSGVLFILFWSFPALVIRNLLNNFFGSIAVTSYEDVDYRIRDKILGAKGRESAEEMNWIMETFYFIGRVCSVSIFILMLTYLNLPAELIVKIFIGVTAFWNLLVFIGNLQLEKSLTRKAVISTKLMTKEGHPATA